MVSSIQVQLHWEESLKPFCVPSGNAHAENISSIQEMIERRFDLNSGVDRIPIRFTDAPKRYSGYQFGHLSSTGILVHWPIVSGPPRIVPKK